jgi:hypothetical protein
MLKIEKNIPMPERKRSELSETCQEMNVGDSFYTSVKARPNLAAIAAKTGRQFRVAPEGAGWRVWRKS